MAAYEVLGSFVELVIYIYIMLRLRCVCILFRKFWRLLLAPVLESRLPISAVLRVLPPAPVNWRAV